MNLSAAADSVDQVNSLSQHDRALLELEREQWLYPGAKEAAIRDRLDLSATSFYQRLNMLIDTEAALAFDPVLVRRLLRIRARRIRTSRRR